MSIKSERTRNLRYKKPALASLGYQSIIDELYIIQDECEEIRYKKPFMKACIWDYMNRPYGLW